MAMQGENLKMVRKLDSHTVRLEFAKPTPAEHRTESASRFRLKPMRKQKDRATTRIW